MAIADFSKSLELDSSNYFAYIRRTAAYFMIGNNEAAQDDLSKARELMKGDPNSLYDQGIFLVLNKQYTEAIKVLKEAFAKDSAERVYATTDDLLDPIRNNPEFLELMKAA